MRMRVFAVLIAAWTAGLAAGDEVSLRVRLEPPEVPFHRVATLHISLESPEELDLSLPGLPEEIEGLELREGASLHQLREGRRLQEQTYVLDPIAANTYALPALEVTWGEDGRAATPPLYFRVRELTQAEEAAAQDFVDIVTAGALLAEQRRQPWGWMALAGVLLALAAAGAACYLWKKSAPGPIATPPTPWELAYQRLQALQGRQLPAQGKAEQYYIDLSAILRFYIEDRFHVHAPEQTTQEFLDTAAKNGAFSDAHQRLLADFLRLADRVKFALHVPSAEAMEASYDAALQFVRETEPKPEPAAAESLREAAT